MALITLVCTSVSGSKYGRVGDKEYICQCFQAVGLEFFFLLFLETALAVAA